MGPGRRRLLAVAGIVLVLGATLCSAWFGMHRWVRGEGFHRLLEHRLSTALHADVRLAPLQWQGTTFSSASVSATGTGSGALSRLSVETLTGEWNPRSLWRGVWRLDALRVASATVVLGEDGRARSLLPAPDRDRSDRAKSRIAAAGWWQRRLEVGRVQIENFSLSWNPARPESAGMLRQVQLDVARLPGAAETYAITGRGGRFTQAGFPALALDALRLEATPGELRILEVTGRPETGGTVQISGTQRLDGDRMLNLEAEFNGVPAAPFLPEDWRARLRGIVSGTVRVTGPAEDPGRLAVTGKVRLRDGQLEALPILGDLAFLGAADRFRRLALRDGNADFYWSTDRLDITNLRLVSEGSLRLQGGFSVVEGQIAGTLQVGVPRSALRWLPGAGRPGLQLAGSQRRLRLDDDATQRPSGRAARRSERAPARRRRQ